MNPVLAQSGGDGLDAILKMFGLMVGAIFAVYLYFAIVLTALAVKTRTPNAWLAWIPIGNAFLLISIARRSPATFLLLLIPIVNIIVGAMLWMSVAENRGKPAWTGALFFIPGLGLLVPIYLLTGPKTDPGGVAPAARICPHCGTAATPQDAFCGECGTAIPSASGGETHLKRTSALQLSAVGAVLAAVCLVGSGLVGWTALGSMLSYSPPERVAAKLPSRLSGVMKEFPIDTSTDSPAKPDALVAESFDSGSSETKVPKAWLPKSVDRGKIPARARTLTAATYRTNKKAKPVAVTVMEPRSGGEDLGKTTMTEVTEGEEGTKTGVSVESPEGDKYEGVKVESDSTQTYVLVREDNGTVIVIFTNDPANFDTADRLAQNVGNGDGLAEAASDASSDLPASPVFLLPAELPAGLELVSIESLTPDDIFSEEEMREAERAASSDEEARKALAMFKQLLPDRWTVAEYKGPKGTWKSILLDYGQVQRAWFTYQFYKSLLAALNLEAVEVRGVDGRYGNTDNTSSLIFSKGPYIAVVDSPKGTPKEQVVAFGNALQL